MTASKNHGTALVTSASSGIGALYADRLARRGDDLTLVARHRERLEALAQPLARETGRTVGLVVADLNDRKEVRRVDAVRSSDANLTLLVNNAASAPPRRCCADGSSARHARAPWHPDDPRIFGRSSDDDRCHRLDLEAREHEWLLPICAIACGQSGRMGHHAAAAGLGKGKADRRTSVQARRGRRSSPPSDRRPSLRQSGVGGVVTGG
jgi:short chain dehydrogenase